MPEKRMPEGMTPGEMRERMTEGGIGEFEDFVAPDGTKFEMENGMIPEDFREGKYDSRFQEFAPEDMPAGQEGLPVDGGEFIPPQDFSTENGSVSGWEDGMTPPEDFQNFIPEGGFTEPEGFVPAQDYESFTTPDDFSETDPGTFSEPLPSATEPAPVYDGSFDGAPAEFQEPVTMRNRSILGTVFGPFLDIFR